MVSKSRSSSRETPDARREQLLAVGAQLFGERAYVEVEISDIAARAGVSRGLLYHYFTDKRGFFAAVVRAEVDRLATATAFPQLPGQDAPGVEALVRAGIDAYLDHIAARPHWYRALYTGATSTHPEIQAALEQSYRRQVTQILATAGVEPTSLHSLAARSWISFLAVCGLGWLDGHHRDRAEVRDMCARALLAALAT